MNNAKISFLSRAAAAVLFSLTGLLAGCQAAKVTGQMASSGTELTDQLRVGEYQIRTFRTGEGDGWAEITKAGRLVYRREGWSFKIGTMSDWVKQDCRQWEGKDLTGSGKPAVILYEWTGGAYGLYDAIVVELDTPVAGLITPCKEIAEIHGTYSVPRFLDLDGDGRPEIIIEDWMYSYWPNGFGDSPAPKVILKWRNGRYDVAPELMRTPTPTGNKLAAMAKRTRKAWDRRPDGKYDREIIPSSLFQTALDLMYGGHEALGWKYIAMAWDQKYPMDVELINELKYRMRQSECWQAFTKQPAPVSAVQPQEWAMRKWRELEKQQEVAPATPPAIIPAGSSPSGQAR